MDQHRITFRRENNPPHDRNNPSQEQTLTVPSGTRLNDAAIQAGYDLRTHCGGAGTCGKCQVIAGNHKLLACQTLVTSDLIVIIPDAALRTNEQNVVVQIASESAACRPQRAVSKGFGIAVDIGTTTLAAELHDFSGKLPTQTASCANPQRKFGDDVMTRIQKVMENPAALTAMQKLIVGAINQMTAELTAQSGIVPEDVSRMVVAGNTVMQSLFFGIDPTPLGGYPFRAPAETFPARHGSEIGLTMSAGATVKEGTVEALPIFGGFVGGDIVAGVLTLPLLLSGDAPRLFLDIGTNGEIVLAYRGELFTAATAAGPAFEGAKIECGTIAIPGAIDRVAVNRDAGNGNEGEAEKIIILTIGNKPAVGICGSGLIDAAAVLLELGIILPNGRFADKRSYFELVSAMESATGKSIVLTQKDIRELQLAAGAVRAGITLLLDEHGIEPAEIETFYVSGGFGQSIRLSSARRIGLLPSIPPERFRFCGNTSLAGARAMLLNPDNDEIVRRIVQKSHHCDLASLPRFQEVFAESMCWEQSAAVTGMP